MNDLDARIRAAVTELADAAPPPKPLPAMSAERDRSHRWMAIAAASVLIVGGIVAIATWQSNRDDVVPVDIVDTVGTTTPGVTLPPPPTTATAPVTTAPDTAERTIPVGQITARPDDVLAVDADGALLLIGIDGDDVAPPVTLVAAPADPTSQRIQVAGLVDGTVLYGVTRANSTTVMAVTAPGAEPIELARSGGGPWLSPDGEQWATTSGGQLLIQRTDGSPGATVDAGGFGAVAWSPDGTSLYATESDSGLAWLRRYSVDDGYALTGQVERYKQGIQVAGFDGSGNLVAGGLDHQENESTLVTTFDPVSLEVVDGVWDRTISPPVAQVSLSPDGSRLMTVEIDGGATIIDSDGTTFAIDDVSVAWFAGAVTTGAPTPPTTTPVLGVVVDGPVVTLSTDDGAMDGKVGGVLTYDGTCLSLVEPGTGTRTPVVWREGTAWDAGAFSVVLSDGRTVALGDRVEAGGGNLRVAGLSAALLDAIGPCAIGESVAIVQSAETVTPLTFPVTTGESPPLPTGELAVGPDDVVATRPDGTLWWYPGLLGDAPGEPVRLVELGDPSVAVEEGPGPNVVDAVAGVVDGTLLFGECCEPVAGAVSALTAPGAQREGIGFGSYPVLHPTLPRLATVSPFGLTVTDLATSTATSAAFDTDPTVARSQVAWAGNSGESLIVLGWDEAGWRVEAFRPDDLSRRILVRPLGLPSPVSSTGPVDVTIAGIDKGWNLILAISDASGTRLSAIDPDDLVVSTPNPWNTTLPGAPANVHLSSDNRLLWVEGDTLTVMTPATQPRALATGVVEGWFAAPASPLPD